MKNILCMMGLHKENQIGFGSITMPTGLFHCNRSGVVWKWNCDGGHIYYDFESEQDKNKFIGLAGRGEQLKLEHKK